MQFAIPVALCDPTELTAIASTADACGYGWIAVSDHLIYPREFSQPYPYTKDGKPRFSEDTSWPDPWIAISAMAAVSQQLKFYTNVYVLPARNPVHVAKFLATLAVMSNNRVALGAGMGWMSEEFNAGGQPFAKRGARADEMLGIIKALHSGEMVEHHGQFFDLPALKMRPAPTAPVPVFVGGFSDAALKRAAQHDGWISDVHTTAELQAFFDRIEQYRRDCGREKQPFERLCFGTRDAVDLDGFRRLRDMGVTALCTPPWFFYPDKVHGGKPTSPLSVKLDAIKRFADDYVAKL
jgi:probable F420-dependent oxidoreductase